MDGSDADFAHTDRAGNMRREKAITLARYVWERGIDAVELQTLSDEQRRKLARAAGVNPPSTSETWNEVAGLLDRKDAWAAANPDHPSATPQLVDEKIMWIKPPITPWT
ncbi:hypothetical protein [Antrihabitans sp. YC2-6]|uniref:hypothetical protein n=1 Tax=Antrihabitans sp. YC2-6 TaxID=2799498 RepID=UPI0018F68880|nr:hypothetical protein [Antrihabitans sp. YC2-6]MBJ8347574.1 hypothetical protein [Antrihabitans sp. YC2-6]